MIFNNMFDVGQAAVVMMMPVVVMVMIVVVRMVVIMCMVVVVVMMVFMLMKVFMLIIAMLVRMFMLAMFMRMLVIVVIMFVRMLIMLMLVVIMLMLVVHALFFLAVHRDRHVGPANAALLRRLRLHDHARNPQRVESLHKPIPVRDQLQQRGGKHIAGRTHLTIKIKGSHFNFLSLLPCG